MAAITLVYNPTTYEYVNGDVKLTRVCYAGDMFDTLTITTKKGVYSGQTSRPDTYFGRVIGDYNPRKGYFYADGNCYHLTFSEDWLSVTIEY